MGFQYEAQDVGTGDVKKVNIGDAPDAVNVPSPAHKTWMEQSRLPRTLLTGTDGMKAAGNKYLPKHPLESNESYAMRLEQSVLLNAFGKTGSYLSGQVFQADIIFEDGVDQQLKDWSEKIDVKGNDINVFLKRVFQHGITKGVSHILVDAPDTNGQTLTVKEEQEQGIRPYFKEIRPEDVIGWLTDEDTGRLIQVRIKEAVKKRVGQYGYKQVNRIRVLEPGTWELHEINDDDGSSVMIKSGTFSVPEIPLVSFIPGEETSIMTGITPINDLADLNLANWRSRSDQINILSVGRVPILFGKMIEVAEMPVGTSVMVTSQDTDSDLMFVEVQGKAIESGANDLKENESQMALYGLQQLIPRSGNMTATEKAINSAESNSSLGTWATEFETTVQAAFEIMGMFGNVGYPSNGAQINKEYNLGVADPQELAVILKSQEQGILSAQATFTEFRRRGVYDEHITWADVEADIEQEQREKSEMNSLASSFFGEESKNEK